MLRPHHEWEEEFCNVFSFQVQSGELISQEIVKYLYRDGLDVLYLRELARENHLSYSFVDDTPGSSTDHVCFYVAVDSTNRTPRVFEGQSVEWVSLDELLDAMRNSPSLDRTVAAGIVQLYGDRTLFPLLGCMHRV